VVDSVTWETLRALPDVAAEIEARHIVE